MGADLFQAGRRTGMTKLIKVFLVLHNFAWTRLENLHFLNLSNNFHFNAIWHGQSIVPLILCRRLAGSDITVMLSVPCMTWLRWCYSHAAHLVSSSPALAFLSNMSEKCKSASPIAIQVENWQKAISTEERLDVISRLEWGERIVDRRCNVRFAHSSLHTIHDNADRIKESSKSETKVFVCVYHSPIQMNHIKKLWMWDSYTFIALEINK
jgi:hypothetical protein